MGADQDVDLALLQRCKDVLALAARARARSAAPCANRPTAAKAVDGLEMLARQKLGRRHQRGLRASLDRGRHGEQRDDGLAAADIALQQPQHAVRAGQVGVDLGKRARLRAGELEGKGG